MSMSHHCRIREVDGTTGTLLHGGKGVDVYLESIVVGTAVAAAVVTVYEGVDTTGTIVATISAAAQGQYVFRGYLHGGLYVTVTGGAAKVSVVAE